MGDGTGVGDGDDFWKISNQSSFEYLYNSDKKYTVKNIPKIKKYFTIKNIPKINNQLLFSIHKSIYKYYK